MGMKTSMAGQEGIPSVFSPMARTLNDLTYFTRSFIGVKPWLWDHTVHPIEWRGSIEEEIKNKKIFNVGVMRTDGENKISPLLSLGRREIQGLLTLLEGVVDPSPACARAVERTVSALRSQGHNVKEIKPPSPYLALQIASILLNSDGTHTYKSFFRTGETNDPGASQLTFYMRLPRPLKYLYYLWVKYVRRDDIWAGLLKNWREQRMFEQWRWVAKREAYKALWHDWWSSEDVDFLITPANATPAIPHKGMKQAVSSCGYTFLFNLVS